MPDDKFLNHWLQHIIVFAYCFHLLRLSLSSIIFPIKALIPNPALSPSAIHSPMFSVAAPIATPIPQPIKGSNDIPFVIFLTLSLLNFHPEFSSSLIVKTNIFSIILCSTSYSSLNFPKDKISPIIDKESIIIARIFTLFFLVEIITNSLSLQEAYYK